MKNLAPGFTDIINAEKILKDLRKIGIEKLTFAGGEPLLHPLLYDFVRMAKKDGFTVSLQTNGYYITENTISKIAPYVDWIGISIDSNNEKIEKTLGRGYGNHVRQVKIACNLVHKYDINLKVNTTVTKQNYQEDMRPLITELNPRRWKIFQVLHIKGQNDEYFDKLSVTDHQFQEFKAKNEGIILNGGSVPVFEKSSDMVHSYFILSPSGMVINNSNNEYKLIPLEALKNQPIEVALDPSKYEARGGIYKWNTTKS